MSDVLWVCVIAVALPVILLVGGDMFRRWLTLKEKQLDQAARLAAERAVEQAAHVERLEGRMRVLERIVTDRGMVVADEIDRLQTTA